MLVVQGNGTDHRQHDQEASERALQVGGTRLV